MSGHFAYGADTRVDTDLDGISNNDEESLYHTNPLIPDTDGDGFYDGDEIRNLFDPNTSGDEKLEKVIHVSLKSQSLVYSLGRYKVGEFLISSGLPRTPSPTGTFAVIKKKLFVTYKGPGYFYPNTKWNLYFYKGAYAGIYIHSAYWHNSFGKPKSHGCINVSYENMEKLYNWADEGTKIVIEQN